MSVVRHDGGVYGSRTPFDGGGGGGGGFVQNHQVVSLTCLASYCGNVVVCCDTSCCGAVVIV